MKKHKLAKPASLLLCKESIRILDRSVLVLPKGAATPSPGTFGGRNCDPGNSGIC